MHKLLLIEDDPLLRESIKTAFGSQLYQICTTGKGIEGLNLALNQEYDLIILDLLLPDKNGFMIAKQIRGYGKETPILIISSRKEVSDIVAGLDCGADGYLCKPFCLQELKSRVAGLLRRPPRTRKEKYNLGSMTLDTNTGLVTRGRKEINLPNKQFQILKYLCTNCERIISKQELLDALWEADSDTMVNTLDVHMSKLRKQMTSSLSIPDDVICTIHGKGYRIKPII